MINQQSTDFRIGGKQLNRGEAFVAAQAYLSGEGKYSYPGYDSFDGGSGPDALSDGDLVAPVVLNVRSSVEGFYTLQRLRPKLEMWLRAVPTDATLADADGEGREALGELFALLDERTPGVRGATLAKVMHRKRPAFIPLYDKYIHRTYVEAAGAPITKARNRPWRDFMLLLVAAMQDDLRREAQWLADVQSLATDVPITSLRALDIVAWEAGRLSEDERTDA